MKPVFDYLDFRDYLKDYYEYWKERKELSYRIFSQRAGFSSPVFIKMVIEGKSKLSKDSANKLAKAMGLIKKQRRYFIELVLFNQADHIDDKMKHLATMKELTHEAPLHHLNSDQLEFYSSWYHPVVRELVGMLKKADPSTIANEIVPQLKEEEIAESINLLKRLALLIEDEKGELKPEDTIVSTEGLPVGNLVIRATQKRLAELGGEAIEQIAPKERDISGITLSLSEELLPQISEELKRCRRTIMKLVREKGNEDRVYRLNLHLFPLSKNIHNREEESC